MLYPYVCYLPARNVNMVHRCMGQDELINRSKKMSSVNVDIQSGGRRLTDDSWGPMGWAAEEFARLGGSVKMTHRFGKTWHLEKVNWRYSGWWAQLEKNKETTRCFFLKGRLVVMKMKPPFFGRKKDQETLPEVAFFEI